MELLPMGDRAVLVQLDHLEDVHRWWSALSEQRPAWIEDMVAGARSVLLIAADGEGDPLTLASGLAVPDRPAAAEPRRTVSIPVAYDGPDLDSVAGLLDVTPDDVVALHSAATYTVGFLGFSPGFAYLFGGDPRLAVPRLASPRTSVPAGSVAVAGHMTAVYPQSTPGGWRIIGSTDAAMFDPFRDAPALLAPGDRVMFRPVDEVLPPQVSHLRRPVRPAAPPALEVLDPGPLLTVQDRGRPGWAHAGVPVAGAADRRSAAMANRLAGNPPGAAVLESTLGRCRLRLLADRTVAVTGAVADLTVDGLPARRHAGLPLRAGSELSLGGVEDGLRVYIAVGGGLEAEEVLGSRSTDTLSGLGPSPLRVGDLLGLGPLPAGTTGSPRPDEALATPLPGRSRSIRVGARLGPRADWLSADGLAALARTGFLVGGSSDRTGVRLAGPALALARSGELPSEGMVPGAVQLPPDGNPIVLMRNHPPTGGYPVVAVVDDEGVDALAQASPGDVVSFRLRDLPS